MPDGPEAATISVFETLELLDSKFLSFAQGFAEGKYAVWLGSGISLGKFPGLKDLVLRALEFLRSRADFTSPDCTFRQALMSAFDLADLEADDISKIKFDLPCIDWPAIELLKTRLQTKYSEFLNIEMDGQALDTLLWEGVKVAETYSNDAVEPDAEHIALALLIREGAISQLASANWDALVERAFTQSTGNTKSIDVVVKSTDLQNCSQTAKIVKFHGCAVKALHNEAEYRDYLVARIDQIDQWMHDGKMAGIRTHLTSMITQNRTLMLGLSAQDSNIRALFVSASDALAWDWPGDMPAYVFSEDAIGDMQRALLQSVYKEHFKGIHKKEVVDSSLIRAFAKPLLIGLLLHCYFQKVEHLASVALHGKLQNYETWLKTSTTAVRDKIATANKGDHLQFLQSLIPVVSNLKAILSTGEPVPDTSLYLPVTPAHPSQIEFGPELQASGISEAAVVTALVGTGVQKASWELSIAPPNGHLPPVICANDTPLYVVSSVHADVNLGTTGLLDATDDAIVVCTNKLYEPQQRSPKRSMGRTGSGGTRRVSIKEMIEETNNPEELFDRFRLEIAL